MCGFHKDMFRLSKQNITLTLKSKQLQVFAFLCSVLENKSNCLYCDCADAASGV